MNNNQPLSLMKVQGSILFITVLCVYLLVSCSTDNQEINKEQKNSFTKEERMRISQNSLQNLIKKEQKQIKNYIARSGVEFTKTSTGCYFYKSITSHQGDSLNYGDVVTIRYSLSLLSGKSLKDSIAERIKVSQNDKENGFQECLSLCKRGETATFIIPSYMAYGFSGNDEDIPPLSTLIYDIEIQ